MSERLSSADVAFLYLERRTTPQHVGGLAIFTAPGGFDYDRLVRLLEERISLAPRYRQKLRNVPANLANPVWVDDPRFDITYHVRRSALPGQVPRRRCSSSARASSPGCSTATGRCGRCIWSKGLRGDRVAVLTKTHPSMVDGHAGIDITQVLLDESPAPRRTVAALWMPEREPSAVRLAADAVRGAVRRPAAVADAVRLASRDARSTASWLTGSVSGLAAAATGALVGASRPSRNSPLRTTLGQHRRIAIERTQLADFRLVRERCGGTVNDVVLAVVTGALRSWLLSRGERLAAATSVRALVPVGMNSDESPGWTKSSQVTGLLVDLPVGEADPLRRLAQIQYAMAAHSTAGRPVGADALVGLTGFAPPTLHSLGARAANGLTRRMYSVAVTNVPGPQQPLYAAGAQMTEMFPLLPLNEGQALSIALTSYNGGVYFGVNADRDAVPDVAAVAAWLGTSLGDLVVVSTPADIEPGTRRRRARRESRT